MAKRKYNRARQFGALPWRIGNRGTREVMLLTPREMHRWVIPKGWPMKGRKPTKFASQEAYEEAGLIAHIMNKRPIGLRETARPQGDPLRGASFPISGRAAVG
jgi:hypothetical protein